MTGIFDFLQGGEIKHPKGHRDDPKAYEPDHGSCLKDLRKKIYLVGAAGMQFVMEKDTSGVG